MSIKFLRSSAAALALFAGGAAVADNEADLVGSLELVFDPDIEVDKERLSGGCGHGRVLPLGGDDPRIVVEPQDVGRTVTTPRRGRRWSP